MDRIGMMGSILRGQTELFGSNDDVPRTVYFWPSNDEEISSKVIFFNESEFNLKFLLTQQPMN